MPHDRVLTTLDATWQDLLDALDAVPDTALTEPGVSGDWSVRDLMHHIAVWQREFLKALPVILEGKRLPRYKDVYGGIDAFNAMQFERGRQLSPSQARQELVESHAELLAMLRDLPAQEPRTEQRLRRRLRDDTYGHYREHIEQIRKFSEEQSRSA